MKDISLSFIRIEPISKSYLRDYFAKPRGNIASLISKPTTADAMGITYLP
jgi:hypothetical protein